MGRYAETAKALGYFPLIEAGGADAAGVEGVPDVVAFAHPTAVLAWRPAAQRTANVRS